MKSITAQSIKAAPDNSYIPNGKRQLVQSNEPASPGSVYIYSLLVWTSQECVILMSLDTRCDMPQKHYSTWVPDDDESFDESPHGILLSIEKGLQKRITFNYLISYVSPNKGKL